MFLENGQNDNDKNYKHTNNTTRYKTVETMRDMIVMIENCRK